MGVVGSLNGHVSGCKVLCFLAIESLGIGVVGVGEDVSLGSLCGSVGDN